MIIQKELLFGMENQNHIQDQPLFQKLLEGNRTPHFFARWDNKDPQFSYLGVGNVVSFKDGHPCLDGNKNEVETIELKLTVEDSGEIIPIQNQTNVDKEYFIRKQFNSKVIFPLRETSRRLYYQKLV